MVGIIWGRCLALIAASLLFSGVHGPVEAQSRPAGYVEAEAVFKRLSPEERVYVQTLMTATGYWNAVPNVDFSARVFEAIKRLQAEMGQDQSGQLGSAELAQLERIAAPLLRRWGFRQVRHPDRPVAIWVPFGLGLGMEKDANGLTYQAHDRSLITSFKHYNGVDLRLGYGNSLKYAQEKGHKVHFSVIRPDFFVISSSTPGGVDMYERYHRDGAGITGFALFWKNEATELRAERVAMLISASLWGQHNRLPLTPPERLGSPRFQPAAQAVLPPVTGTPAAVSSRSGEATRSGTGTGFVVTSQGHVVTNAHVIDACRTVEVSTAESGKLAARIVARDNINDVALLQASELKPTDVSVVRTGAKLGEQVAAFGYPLAGVLAVSGNFTLGNVTSLAGLANDSRYLQISTPVQPGNSGGPLLDQHGNVVGIVTSKLNALKAALVTGDIPQNVNFALKIGAAANLLETSGVTMPLGATERNLTPVELADRARRVSVQVHCTG